MTEEKQFLGKAIGLLRSKVFRLQRFRYAAATTQLTVEETILLNMINQRPSQIMQNIALVTGKNKSVIMRLVNSLEEKGLIERETNSEDRREKLVSLTDVGKKVIKQYAAIESRLSAELLQGVSEEDIKTFLSTAEAISRNAEAMLLETKNSK